MNSYQSLTPEKMNSFNSKNIVFVGETRKKIRVTTGVMVRIRVTTRVKSPPGDDKPSSQPVLKILGF